MLKFSLKEQFLIAHNLFSVAEQNQFLNFSSWWSGVEVGPPDPIFGLLEAYNKDERATKVNLTVGAYRDDQGKPYVLDVVKQVCHMIVMWSIDLRMHLQIERDNLEKYKEKEYAGILGYPAFHRAAIEFALTPQEKHVKDNLVIMYMYIYYYYYYFIFF